MTEFNIKLIDTVFKINCNYSYFYELAKDYITTEKEDIVIDITEEDISLERKKSDEFNKENGMIDRSLLDEELESFSIQIKVAYYFLDKNVLLMHGAAIAKDDEGYLFIASSGTGKTTHINLWMELYPDAFPVNGDTPLVAIKDNNVYVTGCPWAGREGLQTNKIVPLKAICFLNRSKTNKIAKFDDTDMKLEKLYGHILKKSDKTLNIIKNIKTIIENVDFYTLECNMDIDAARVAYEGMKQFLMFNKKDTTIF